MCVEDLVLDAAGLYGLLWDMPFDAYSAWVEKHSWIYSIVEYAYDHNIQINCKHSTLEPQRQGNRSIMECVSAYNMNTSDLRAINRVRQLHGVVHLIDIPSADAGGFLNSEFLCPSQFDDGEMTTFGPFYIMLLELITNLGDVLWNTSSQSILSTLSFP